MKIQCLVLLASVIFMFGCNSHKAETLNPVDSLGWQESEEYFIKEPRFILADENNIYCDNGAEPGVLVFNKEDFSFVNSVGKKGRGPGEYLFLTSAEITEDFIWLYDPVQAKIDIFSKKFEYIDCIKQDNFLLSLNSFDNELFAITDIRQPELRLLTYENNNMESIETYSDAQSAMEFIPNEDNILELSLDYYESKIYMTYMQNSVCCILIKVMPRE